MKSRTWLFVGGMLAGATAGGSWVSSGSAIIAVTSSAPAPSGDWPRSGFSPARMVSTPCDC